ncbi:phytoene desaturase [Mycolicibacterium tokaiense]|uniref:Phytoene desaturase n=1 Tax=Mycolicibacterium tokaiense TaxID=39695 RepID=A0A378TCA1_9MYCO|nr:hypothetical protein MTOK_37870 [Mycolicibacterium tokaiense]STZ57473.1 phytoene desaturase [Mycolicibacterium tokaiense]
MILRVRRPAHVVVIGTGRGVRVTRLYRGEFDGFICFNVELPLSLVNSNSLALLSLGGFRRWDAVVRTFTRLPRVFTFQALSAGVSFPEGGMRAVPDATAAAAGVDFRYDTTVTELVHNGGVVTAVGTDAGARFAADAVVLMTSVSGRLAADRLTESPSRQRHTVVAR